MRARFWQVLAAALCFLQISCGSNPDDLTVQGSGATFPAPLYKRWFLEYYKQHRNVRINYQAIGSGAGIRQFTEALTSFGASDADMNDKEIAKALETRPGIGGVLMLPMTAGSVALCYNIPGVAAEQKLKLSREVLVGIVFGDIDNWNDEKIAKINPDLKLPDQPITWVRRADGSGTTYCFTNHVSAISARWKKEVGVNKSVSWPVGIGGKGNPGVAAIIKQTPGAIGYVEYGYAELSELPMALMQNRAGSFVAPDAKSSLAALKQGKMPVTKGGMKNNGNLPDFRAFIPDPTGHDAYPIVTYTWMLIPKRYDRGDPERAKKVAATVRDVLRYCLTDGQKLSDELGYVPLPKNVVEQVLKAVDQIEPRE